jgi:hypothetical protein
MCAARTTAHDSTSNQTTPWLLTAVHPAAPLHPPRRTRPSASRKLVWPRRGCEVNVKTQARCCQRQKCAERSPWPRASCTTTEAKTVAYRRRGLPTNRSAETKLARHNNWGSSHAGQPTLRSAGTLQGVPPSCCGRRAAVAKCVCSNRPSRVRHQPNTPSRHLRTPSAFDSCAAPFLGVRNW